MTREKWNNILATVDEKFGIKNKRSEPLEDMMGTREIIEFDGPMGEMRLTLDEHPRITGKKTDFSQRYGSNVKVDYTYDMKEIVQTMKVWKRNDEGEWEEMNVNMFA
jgi:hypothetical protein